MDHRGERWVLTITRARRVYLGNTEIPPAELERKLSSNARIQKEKELYLHADRSLPYGQVVEIMAVAPRAGGGVPGMITQPHPGVGGPWSAAPPPPASRPQAPGPPRPPRAPAPRRAPP